MAAVSNKKSKEAHFFKLLRNLSEDLWKVRKGKEKLTEEFLADFSLCFEKVAKALPHLEQGFSKLANGLIYEICSELSLLLLDKAYFPVFTRLIVAFSKNSNNMTSKACVLKFLCVLDYQPANISSVSKSSFKELQGMVKLSKDKEKRRTAKEACIATIKKACKECFSLTDLNTSSLTIKRMLSDLDPEYHSKSPKNMIGQ